MSHFMSPGVFMMRSARSFAVVLAAASALLFAQAGNAQDAHAQTPEKKHKPKQVPDVGLDEVVASDPVGEARLEQMTSRSSEGLTVVEHDGVMLSVDLQGRFMNVMVAAPAADGRQATSCLTGPEANRVVQASKTAKPVKAGKSPAKTKTAPKTAPADLEVK